MLRSSLFAFTAAATAALAPVARAQHGSDIVLAVENGRIITGAVDEGVPVFPERVFESEFGELGTPNVTTEPGFDSDNGAFPAGRLVGISVRKALRAWTGEDFATLPDERIQITKNAVTIETPAADPPAGQIAGSIALGLASSSGRLHQHAAFRLTDPAAPGIYLLELQAWMGDAETGVSEPFWIVCAQGEQPDHDAAVAWVEANFADPCIADFNGDGELSVADFTAFRNAYLAGDTAADLSGNGVLDVTDFTAFRIAYLAGCP